MRELQLNRFCFSDHGTFGTMMVAGQKLYTVERPWANNERSISCIPGGAYICRSRPFYRGGYDAIEVCDVQDRSYILFHVANTMRDVRGCIGVGYDLGYVNRLWAVTSSRLAFQYLMQWFTNRDTAVDRDQPGEPFRLIIDNVDMDF